MKEFTCSSVQLMEILSKQLQTENFKSVHTGLTINIENLQYKNLTKNDTEQIAITHDENTLHEKNTFLKDSLVKLAEIEIENERLK